jgi:WD40 repeat protein
MEKNKACSLCKKSDEKVFTFTCKHSICRLCIDKSVIFNQLAVFKEIKRTLKISTTCIVCSKGTHETSKAELLDFILEPGKDKCKLHSDMYLLFYCRTCAKLLCYNCLADHVKNFSKHKITNNLSQVSNLCTKHPSETEKYKCTNCNVNICRQCKYESHEGHKVTVLKEFSSEVPGDTKKSESVFANENEIEKYIDDLLVPIKKNLIENKNEVLNKCTELIKLLEEMRGNYESQYKSLEEDIQVTHLLIKKSYIDYFRKVNQNNKDSKIAFDKDFFFYEKLSLCGTIIESLNKAKFELLNQKAELNGKDLSEICFDMKKLDLKIKQTLRGHTQSVWTVCQLRTGKIASGSGDKTIRLWDPTQNYTCIKTLTGHGGTILKLQELQNGELASCSKDATVRIWDPMQDFTCIRILEGHTDAIWTITQLQGDMFATGSHDKTIRIWTKDFKCLKVLQGHEGYVNSVVQLDDGRLVSASNDNTIRVWKDYQCVKIIKEHTSFVNCLIKLNDNRIASGSEDTTIIIYDVVDDFKVIKVLEGHANIVNSLYELDDKRLVSGSYDNTIMIWDPALDYKCVKELEGHTNYVNSIYQLKDGALVSASADNTVRLWG